jgi:DNA-binding transcriptional regulator YiaG
MTNLEMRRLAGSLDLQGIRESCRFTLDDVSAGLRIHRQRIHDWECRRYCPSGEAGGRYLRVILAMRNHLEVAGGDAARPGWGRAA